MSPLFDFATRNLHLATNFYHLVAKWRLNDFVNFKPWIVVQLCLCMLLTMETSLLLVHRHNPPWGVVIFKCDAICILISVLSNFKFQSKVLLQWQIEKCALP